MCYRCAMSLMNAPKLSLASLVTLLLTVSSPSAVAYTGAGSGILRAQLCSSPAELLRAARGGDVESMRILGKMLIEGNGVKRDVKNGVKWIKMAAEQGDSGAMLMMGDLYRKGFGVPQDMDKAVEYYILADENGNKNAAKRIDKLSLKDSLPYWEKKVADGNKKATIKLMLAHATGDGIPKDLDKAKDLYELANKKWPTATENALDKMPEDVKAKLTNSGDYLALTPVDSIAEEYYMNGSEDECRKNYISNLERVKSGLSYVSLNKQEMTTPRRLNDIIGCYAAAELYRLTLISKYGVSSKKLELASKELRKEIKQKYDSIESSIDWETQSAGDMVCIMTLGFLTQGGDGENRREIIYRSSAERCLFLFALVTDDELKKVTSARNGSAAMQACFSGTYHKIVGNFIAATCPAGFITAKSDYTNLVKSIANQVNRISQANYYNSETIEEYINMIRKSYNLK